MKKECYECGSKHVEVRDKELVCLSCDSYFVNKNE